MSFAIEELYPGQVSIILNGIAYKLRYFDLNAEVWCIENFSEEKKTNGMEILYNKLISKKFDVDVFKLLYELLDHKVFSSYTNFLNDLGKCKTEISSSIADIKNKLIANILNSRPLIKNPKREKEISEFKKRQTGGTCYGKYYDRFAKRYSYTLEEFYRLTLRQIHGLLKIIGDESYKELEVKATLAGRKLKPRIEEIEVSIEDEKASMDHANEIVERLRSKNRKFLNAR